jgi:hypothetical protein
MIPPTSATKRETETRVLVGCGAEKQSSRAPARDLYTSDYFAKKREYAEAYGDTWTVLSALHGSLATSSLVEPYDVTMDDYPLNADEYPDAEFRTTDKWAASVIEGLENCVHNLERWDDRRPLGRVEILAGQAYVTPLRDSLDALADEHGFEAVYPFDGTAGIGEQIGWLTDRIEAHDERSAATDAQSAPRATNATESGASRATENHANDRDEHPTLDAFATDAE